MSGTHQVLAYADVVNLMGNDTSKIERNTDVFVHTHTHIIYIYIYIIDYAV